jgi:hypothetical protein
LARRNEHNLLKKYYLYGLGISGITTYRPSRFDKVGHLPVCKQSKTGWEPFKFINTGIITKLHSSLSSTHFLGHRLKVEMPEQKLHPNPILIIFSFLSRFN